MEGGHPRGNHCTSGSYQVDCVPQTFRRDYADPGPCFGSTSERRPSPHSAGAAEAGAAAGTLVEARGRPGSAPWAPTPPSPSHPSSPLLPRGLERLARLRRSPRPRTQSRARAPYRPDPAIKAASGSETGLAPPLGLRAVERLSGREPPGALDEWVRAGPDVPHQGLAVTRGAPRHERERHGIRCSTSSGCRGIAAPTRRGGEGRASAAGSNLEHVFELPVARGPVATPPRTTGHVHSGASWIKRCATRGRARLRRAVRVRPPAQADRPDAKRRRHVPRGPRGAPRSERISSGCGAARGTSTMR